MIIEATRNFNAKELEELFQAAQLELNTSSAIIQSAMLHSTTVIAAYDDNHKLVGIIRSLDDGCWRAYIDCMIIHKEHWGTDLADRLVAALLEALKGVPIINISPNEERNYDIYKRFGLIKE